MTKKESLIKLCAELLTMYGMILLGLCAGERSGGIELAIGGYARYGLATVISCRTTFTHTHTHAHAHTHTHTYRCFCCQFHLPLDLVRWSHICRSLPVVVAVVRQP